MTILQHCGQIAVCLLQDKLQRFQSRAATIITGATYNERSLDISRLIFFENALSVIAVGKIYRDKEIIISN